MPESIHREIEPKPRWRGRLHQAAFIVSIPAGLVLVALAERPAARIAAAIYAMSLIGLYGSSAAYHLGQWSDRALTWMRRLDHSMIYVLIAGTYTPIALIGIGGRWGVTTLAIVWAGAVFGVTIKMIKIDGFRVLGGALYIILGWTAVAAFPEMLRRLSAVQMILIFAGGVLYTGGAIILATRRPNPRPVTFGYHEIWHAMVVAAGICHYIAVMMVALG
jgi:hemolysin III